MKPGKPQQLKATWRGIALRIRFQPQFLSGALETAHLEVWSVAPEKEPLPITETGYRSHFVRRQNIEDLGGPVAYVLGWLEAEAKSPTWKAADFARRQLSLF